MWRAPGEAEPRWICASPNTVFAVQVAGLGTSSSSPWSSFQSGGRRWRSARRSGRGRQTDDGVAGCARPAWPGRDDSDRRPVLRPARAPAALAGVSAAHASRGPASRPAPSTAQAGRDVPSSLHAKLSLRSGRLGPHSATSGAGNSGRVRPGQGCGWRGPLMRSGAWLCSTQRTTAAEGVNSSSGRAAAQWAMPGTGRRAQTWLRALWPRCWRQTKPAACRRATPAGPTRHAARSVCRPGVGKRSGWGHVCPAVLPGRAGEGRGHRGWPARRAWKSKAIAVVQPALRPGGSATAASRKPRPSRGCRAAHWGRRQACRPRRRSSRCASRRRRCPRGQEPGAVSAWPTCCAGLQRGAERFNLRQGSDSLPRPGRCRHQARCTLAGVQRRRSPTMPSARPSSASQASGWRRTALSCVGR